MGECPICAVVDNICSRLSTEEAKRKCKELSEKVMRGELDGTTARKELLKYVDEEELRRAVKEVLPEG